MTSFFKLDEVRTLIWHFSDEAIAAKVLQFYYISGKENFDQVPTKLHLVALDEAYFALARKGQG